MTQQDVDSLKVKMFADVEKAKVAIYQDKFDEAIGFLKHVQSFAREVSHEFSVRV